MISCDSSACDVNSWLYQFGTWIVQIV